MARQHPSHMFPHFLRICLIWDLWEALLHVPHPTGMGLSSSRSLCGAKGILGHADDDDIIINLIIFFNLELGKEVFPKLG